MFAFFAALFGGLYLAGESISESAKQSAADARLAKGREIKNKMLDNDLEWNMRSELNWEPKCGKNLNTVQDKRWKMLREIPEKDLIYVFGDKWEELFTNERVFLPYSPSNDGRMVDIWEVAFNIWLSGRHVLSHNHTGRYYYNNIVRGMPRDKELNKKMILKAARIIERNLKEKFPDVALSKNPINENVFPDRKNALLWNFSLDSIGVSERIYPWGDLTKQENFYIDKS